MVSVRQNRQRVQHFARDDGRSEGENGPIDLPVDGWLPRATRACGAAAGHAVVGPGDGAAVAAIVGGRPVVDLWAGAVAERGLVHTFSAMKPLAATCVLLLVERGRVALDEPGRAVVARVRAPRARATTRGPPRWPTRRGGGRAGAGQPACSTARRRSVALAAAPPDWPPGRAHGEHALTYGNLLGEVVRRVDGRSLGRFLAEEVAGPLRPRPPRRGAARRSAPGRRRRRGHAGVVDARCGASPGPLRWAAPRVRASTATS